MGNIGEQFPPKDRQESEDLPALCDTTLNPLIWRRLGQVKELLFECDENPLMVSTR